MTDIQPINQEIESQLISGRSLEEKLDINEVEILLRSPDFQIISTYRFCLTPWEIAVIPVGLVKTEQIAELIKDLREASFENSKIKRAYEASRGGTSIGMHLAVGLMRTLDEAGNMSSKMPDSAKEYTYLNLRLRELPKY